MNTQVHTQCSNSSNMVEHAPTPWSIREIAPYPSAIVSGNNLIMEFRKWEEVASANARFIVHAVNTNGSLIRALRLVAAQAISDDWTAEKAIRFIVKHARFVLACHGYSGNRSDPAAMSSCHFAAGVTAYCEGVERILPSYFSKPRCKNATKWFEGWDYAKSVDVSPPHVNEFSIPSTEAWRIDDGGTAYYPIAIYSGDVMVAAFHSWDKHREANAEFIVEAAKAHKAMVLTLHEVAALETATITDATRVCADLKVHTRNLLKGAQ